jgi:tRNA(Ile)-lysidine synthase
MALLHGLLQLGEPKPADILVVHLDHGLQVPSADWALWCQRHCQALGLEFRLLKLAIQPQPGESLEAQAREARYAAIQAQMRPGDLLLTGHHADDQAETFMLQLLRGSGLGGLAAMPRLRPFGPGFLARPLLDSSRTQIEAWLRIQGLAWLEDPTNALPHFDRNYLRHDIMPLLAQRWPATLTCIGRTASHCAEAAQLLDELAREQLTALCPQPHQMLIGPLLDLPVARRHWLLRAWLKANDCLMPSQAQLERIATELLTAAQDRQPQVTWGDWTLRRFRGQIYLLDTKPQPLEEPIDWPSPDTLILPGNGRLHLEWRESGLPAELWQQQPIQVRYRHKQPQAGDYCQGRFCSLKKLLQDKAVPPWERQRLPLIFAGEQLVAIAGLAICLKPTPGPGWWPVWKSA